MTDVDKLYKFTSCGFSFLDKFNILEQIFYTCSFFPFNTKICFILCIADLENLEVKTFSQLQKDVIMIAYNSKWLLDEVCSSTNLTKN